MSPREAGGSDDLALVEAEVEALAARIDDVATAYFTASAEQLRDAQRAYYAALAAHADAEIRLRIARRRAGAPDQPPAA